jgi:RNase P/RNase MRP subunit POP5
MPIERFTPLVRFHRDSEDTSQSIDRFTFELILRDGLKQMLGLVGSSFCTFEILSYKEGSRTGIVSIDPK